MNIGPEELLGASRIEIRRGNMNSQQWEVLARGIATLADEGAEVRIIEYAPGSGKAELADFREYGDRLSLPRGAPERAYQALVAEFIRRRFMGASPDASFPVVFARYPEDPESWNDKSQYGGLDLRSLADWVAAIDEQLAGLEVRHQRRAILTPLPKGISEGLINLYRGFVGYMEGQAR